MPRRARQASGTGIYHVMMRGINHQCAIGMAIKRIASSYVYYYNHKCSRDGHLFRERYKSEPVNDMAYFVEQGDGYLFHRKTKSAIINS